MPDHAQRRRYPMVLEAGSSDVRWGSVQAQLLSCTVPKGWTSTVECARDKYLGYVPCGAYLAVADDGCAYKPVLKDFRQHIRVCRSWNHMVDVLSL
jgi:hypothetical protein